MFNYKLARTYLHYIVTFFILFGGIITNNYNIIKFHIIFNTFIIIHWLTNNNKCFLSEYDHDGSNEYSSGLLKKIGINVENNENLLNFITYSVVIIPLFLSLQKLNKIKLN
jgi:hypothetical protein